MLTNPIPIINQPKKIAILPGRHGGHPGRHPLPRQPGRLQGLALCGPGLRRRNLARDQGPGLQ